MHEVVSPERDRGREHVDHVRQDPRRVVLPTPPEDQVVCRLVDHHVHRVIHERADEPCDTEDHPPRTRSDLPGQRHLDGDPGDDDAERPRVATDQAAHLGVIPEDLPRAEVVGLGGIDDAEGVVLS
jgi:hypothetical protein